MTNAVSGLAASIRAATDSETFDLAGHDAINIKQTINDAFNQPFQLDTMIRITFVVGAGKLSRQKYDAKAGLHVTKALQELDFSEDKGASCMNECAGCYKTQHDTGKNVFTVVVFPKLANRGDGDGPRDSHGGGCAGSSEEYPLPIPLVEGTPVHTILLASEETFQKMAPSMCPTWSEKKMCSEVLKLAVETLQSMDNKLMTGTPLSDEENAFYNETGGSASITTKAERLKKLMQQQVENGGQLMQHEIDRLLQQVEEKIDAFDADIDAATKMSQEKKVAKLTAQREKAVARKQMLEGHTAQSPPKLKHDAQIAKLSKELQPLLKLEATVKGRLLSMKETKQLAVKDEMLEEISELEGASRGWFEDEDDFEVRLEASRKKRTAAGKGGGKSASGGKGKKAGTGSSSRSANANTTWLTPGGLAAKQASLGKKTAAAKKSKPRGGGVFSAMMMDSDSDSD
eukprot:CAMPEP_0181081340 /NCGR_PEP_ID=MMETSP1071-20121207/3051_1 /TAXON_ID=35127 /ORGANISM="Thalassiosira sp., Strain NH16" /LENGTH=457 /DNA_ID=CAMNT_0023162883 /DNA_START=49 /DNA_END=1422 /DNA_ORIENTATION=+